jgi:hypothetical protein
LDSLSYGVKLGLVRILSIFYASSQPIDKYPNAVMKLDLYMCHCAA